MSETTTLVTERLTLRSYVEEDRESFVRLNADPQVRRHLDGALSLSAGEALFDRLRTSNDDRAWAICRSDDGLHVGHIFLTPFDEPDGDLELGFLLAVSAWGLGYATEAARVVVAAAAENDWGRLVATVDDDHQASQRVLAKIGFRLLETREDELGPYRIYVYP